MQLYLSRPHPVTSHRFESLHEGLEELDVLLVIKSTKAVQQGLVDTRHDTSHAYRQTV